MSLPSRRCTSCSRALHNAVEKTVGKCVWCLTGYGTTKSGSSSFKLWLAALGLVGVGFLAGYCCSLWKSKPVEDIEKTKNFKEINDEEEESKYGKKGIENSNNLDCPICMDNKIDVALRPCGHTFCKECIEKFIEDKMSQCPICRKKFSKHDKIFLP